MSVAECYEYVEGRQGSEKVEKVAAGLLRIHRQYTRPYIVITDDPLDSQATVLAAPELPIIGQVYLTDNDGDPSAKVMERLPTQDPNDPKLWVVNINYSSNPPFDFNENPFLRAPVWSLDYEKVERARRYDVLGNPYINSARQPFDPPPTYLSVQPVVSISINKTEADFEALGGFAYAHSLQDRVNVDVWNGFPIYTVLAGLKVRQLIEGAYFGYTLDYTLRVRWDAWIPTRYIDQGFYHFKDIGDTGGSDIQLVQARDHTGAPLSSPVLLDGAGGLLPQGFAPVNLEFTEYLTMSFSSIP